MPMGGGGDYDRQRYLNIQRRRDAYGQKLRALGIIPDSNKWRTLMCRKGL